MLCLFCVSCVCDVQESSNVQYVERLGALDQESRVKVDQLMR